MYRASALLAIRNSISFDDPIKVAELIHSHFIDIRDGYIFIDDEDVSTLIRTPDISDAASRISSGSPVRRKANWQHPPRIYKLNSLSVHIGT